MRDLPRPIRGTLPPLLGVDGLRALVIRVLGLMPLLRRTHGSGGRVVAVADSAPLHRGRQRRRHIEARVTAHSGRVGLASELTARGASTTEVMLAGNWKTARMVAHYSAGATAERGAVRKYL